MAYISYSNLPYTIRTQKLSSWGFPTEEAARDAAILECAEEADSIIHSRLYDRFPDDIPFTVATLPTRIKSIARRITIYKLAGEQQVTGETYRTDFDQAIEELDRIADGKTPLYSEADGETLNPYDSTSGFANDTGDDEEDRLFPLSDVDDTEEETSNT